MGTSILRDESRLNRAQTLINSYQVMLLLISITVCILSCNGKFVQALSFEHDTFTEYPSDITFVKQDDWYTGQMPQWNTIAIWLTPDPERLASLDASNLGKVVYKDPVTLTLNQTNTSSATDRHSQLQEASFNTSFTFQIKNMGNYSHCGSGMAFFMSSEIKAPNNSDQYGGLGLVDGTKNATDPPDAPFFALEFDTFKSKTYADVSASHVGIDVSSLVSLNVTDTSNSTSPLYLYHNYTFAVWIEYDAAAHFIQVWMTNVSAGSGGGAGIASLRPPQPCISLQYDLSSVFRTPVYAGFSAANYVVSNDPCHQGVAIFSWSFSSDTLNISASANQTKPPHKSKTLILIIVPCISFIVVLIIAGFVLIKLRSKRSEMESSNACMIQNISNSSSLPRYRLNELKKSTHGFSEKYKLGEGGFSTVFKGTLPSGKTVAIKKFKESVKKEDQFASEIQIINRIRHRNLLQLEGWCYERGHALLLYTYISNGSLDQYLFGKKRNVTLDFNTRLKILKGVASALEYLHSGLGDCILHRDVKAANVLLTEDFEPVLGDFGLARLISHDHSQTLTAAGTPGYVAPELIYTGKATEKADVYSFGVLALELATGHRVCDGPPQSQDASSLFDWVWALQRRNMLLDSLDARMRPKDTLEFEEQEKWKCVLHLGIICCHPSPESRPSMRQVTQALQESTILPLPLVRPIFPNIIVNENSIESIPLIYEMDSSISTSCDPTSSLSTSSYCKMYRNM